MNVLFKLFIRIISAGFIFLTVMPVAIFGKILAKVYFKEFERYLNIWIDTISYLVYTHDKFAPKEVSEDENTNPVGPT